MSISHWASTSDGNTRASWRGDNRFGPIGVLCPIHCGHAGDSPLILTTKLIETRIPLAALDADHDSPNVECKKRAGSKNVGALRESQ